MTIPSRKGYVPKYPAAIENSLARAYRDYARTITAGTIQHVTPALPRLIAESRAHHTDWAPDDPDADDGTL